MKGNLRVRQRVLTPQPQLFGAQKSERKCRIRKLSVKFSGPHYNVCRQPTLCLWHGVWWSCSLGEVELIA